MPKARVRANLGRRNTRLFWALLAAGLAVSPFIKVDGEPLLSVLAPPLHALLGPG